MTLHVHLNVRENLPVNLRHVKSELFFESDSTKLAKQMVFLGNREVEFGELFEVTKQPGTVEVVWHGDLSNVHHIGRRWHQGTLIVEGAAGNHLGAAMSGGEIVAESDVGDYLGNQMQSGTIRIKGNTGDFTGSRLIGERIGMNGGTILINGNAGKGVGAGMRRGLIVVREDVHRGLGWNMLAGSLVVFGKCLTNAGFNMKRGTVVLAGHQTFLSHGERAANFKYSGTYRPPVLALISNQLKRLGYEFPENLLAQNYHQFAGDLLAGGRGEVFCRCDG